MIFNFCDADNSRSVNAEEFAVCINEMMGDEGEPDADEMDDGADADEMDDEEADEEADEEDAPAEGGDDELAAFN